MKRGMKWTMVLGAISVVAGCASGPVVHPATVSRHQPTRVQSLVIVVDDTLFGEAGIKSDGSRFAHVLGVTLRDTAGSIPVTLLQIDNEADARALPRMLLSTHATQVMTLKATRVITSNRAPANAVWQLNIADVEASLVTNPQDPSRPLTKVVSRTFYHEQIESAVGTQILFGDGSPNAEKMGTAIAEQLRMDHVLTPDSTPAI